MIIVTLVATLAAAMVWQQWRAVQVESAERARVQAAWILASGLDFARQILRDDLRSGRPTALTEPWATPLAESRLSTFLAVDASNADDGPEAFLSGNIADVQSRYVLNNLIAEGKVVPAEETKLKQLCESAGVDTGVATRIANGLRDASQRSTTGETAAPLQPALTAQLTWLGIDPAVVQALSPYVVLLPIPLNSAPVPVNVNTASKEVLMAATGIDGGTADNVIRTRLRTPFATVPAFSAIAPSASASAAAGLDVRSNYFEVLARLRLADRVLSEKSLVQRLNTQQINVLSRERVSSLE